MRTKLLIIAPQNPYPPIDGGKVGIYYPLINFSKYFDVTFACVIDKNTKDNEIEKSIAHFKNYGIKFFFAKKDKRDKYINVPKNLFVKESFKWEKFYSQELLNICEKIIASEKITNIWLNHAQMSRYAEELKKKFFHVKFYLREHNLEYEIVKQYAEVQKNYLIKLFAKWQFEKTKKLEVKRWRLFDKVFFISDIDMSLAVREAPDIREKFEVLYDGYDVKEIDIDKSKIKNSIIYPVALQYVINHECLRSFYFDVWLKVKKTFPELTLEISGNPIGEVAKVIGVDSKELEKNGVIELGFLPDIEREIALRKYALSPTKVGSGIRIKLLLGMSIGKPVFCSPLDASTSRHFKDMENVVVYNNADDFIKKLEILENDLRLYEKISRQAQDTIKYNFNWDLYAKKVYEIITNENKAKI